LADFGRSFGQHSGLRRNQHPGHARFVRRRDGQQLSGFQRRTGAGKLRRIGQDSDPLLDGLHRFFRLARLLHDGGQRQVFGDRLLDLARPLERQRQTGAGDHVLRDQAGGRQPVVDRLIRLARRQIQFRGAQPQLDRFHHPAAAFEDFGDLFMRDRVLRIEADRFLVNRLGLVKLSALHVRQPQMVHRHRIARKFRQRPLIGGDRLIPFLVPGRTVPLPERLFVYFSMTGHASLEGFHSEYSIPKKRRRVRINLK
jgi:hypothetical protein